MSRSARSGLSIVEVVIVIAIIVVVIGLMLQRASRAMLRRFQGPHVVREQSQVRDHWLWPTFRYVWQAACDSCLVRLPEASATIICSRQVVLGPEQLPRNDSEAGWSLLLPYLEQDDLYRQFDLEQGYARNLSAAQTRLKTFICPSSPEASRANAFTCYVAMSGIGQNAAVQPARVAGNGFMGFDRLTSYKMITDGSSNTIALMETRLDLGPWGAAAGHPLCEVSILPTWRGGAAIRRSADMIRS